MGKIKPPRVEQFAILTQSRMGNRSYKLLVGSSQKSLPILSKHEIYHR